MKITNKAFYVLMIFLSFGLIQAQNKPETQNGKKIKAEQILEKARKAISESIDIKNVNSFSLDSEESFQFNVGKRQIQGKKKVQSDIFLPNKIRQKTIGDYSTNQADSTYIINGDKFSSNLDIFVNGQRQQDFAALIGEKKLIADLKRNTFLLLYPIILDAAWYTPLEYEHIGIAESKDGKAEIIEAVTPNKTKYRLFFDVKTYFLLMMTEEWMTKEDKLSENKYYFSDYQKKDGLFVATKTVVERNGEVFYEQTIKNFKINPTFKSNLFDIK